MDDLAHMACIAVQAPSAYVFSHLSDGHKVGRWALGSMDLQPTEEADTWSGTSLFDRASGRVKICTQPEWGLIDFLLANPHGERVPLISIRITQGQAWLLPSDQTHVMMTAWRAPWVTPERWSRTKTTHALEVLLFKAQIERDYQGSL